MENFLIIKLDHKQAMGTTQRPSRQEITNAAGKIVPDIIALDLKGLFCGINPGLYSAAVGHHFARPGNRFWPALFQGGITPYLLSPQEDHSLLQWGYGITNVVDRSTASAADLSRDELVEGGKILVEKISRYHPAFLAVLGIDAYRTAFNYPKAGIGEQPVRIAGARVWVLPNPSGLNAHYNLQELAGLLRVLNQNAI